MGALDLLQALRARGLSLAADGNVILVSPAELITDEARALIRQNKPGLLAALAQAAGASVALGEQDGVRHPVRLLPLPREERAKLERLAVAWGMDREDRAVMFRQCDSGGELADGSWISPEEARAFWLAEAGAIH
jgi:hypothetical protein